MLAPSPPQPEQFRPFHGLWDLWDMLEISAYAFVNAVGATLELERRIQSMNAEQLKKPVTLKREKGELVEIFEEFRKACLGIGARSAAVSVEQLLAGFDSRKFTWRALGEEIKFFKRSFEVEIITAKLFVLGHEDASHYTDAVEIFGHAVAAFPSIAAEVDEAGKCLALGRVPATIFHLMRVVEIGLRSLAPPLGIKEPNPSWNTVIRKIDKEIKIEPKDRTLKVDYAFLEGVSAQMHAVNRAWRTRAMHVDATFSLENARDIINATKSLMQHLADGGLREVAVAASPPS